MSLILKLTGAGLSVIMLRPKDETRMRATNDLVRAIHALATRDRVLWLNPWKFDTP